MRWPLLLVISGVWAASDYLSKSYFTPAPATGPHLVGSLEFFLRHWGTVIFYFLIALVGFSLLSCLAAWIWFLVKKHSVRNQLELAFGKGKLAVAGNVSARLVLPGIFRPFFGVVKSRIEFDGLTISPELSLTENVREKGRFWRRAIAGSRSLPLRDRREYHITELQFFFQDMFRLISLPALVPFEQSMYTVSPQLPLREVKADPNKTEEQDIRIPIPKRIEGEYVNYKDFEPGDDVRRIVWKIYARTRQLVVRIPEVTDPYASHIYVYASFFHGMPKGRRESFDAEMLNQYKDQLRNLYESLLQSGMEVRVIPDQGVSTNFSVDESEKTLYYLSTANWQTDRDLKHFVNKKDAAVICISSLTPAEDVENLLMDLPPNVTIVLVKVSEIFRRHRIIRFRDLFFQHRTEDMDSIKGAWLLSGFRRRVISNEKKLAAMIQKMNATGMTV